MGHRTHSFAAVGTVLAVILASCTTSTPTATPRPPSTATILPAATATALPSATPTPAPAVPPTATAAPTSTPRPPFELQVLSVSDWHAQLDPIAVAGTGDVAGAAVLSAYWQADRAKNANTLTLTAGDSIGASPALSAFAEEEPAIKALNLMGVQANTFGNHDFDRGTTHLQKMIELAKYPYVSANLKNVDANLKSVKPFTIVTVNEVKVGIIGVTNPDAPLYVFPGRFGTIEVTEPVAAAMKAKDDAKAAGATLFFAIVHLGVTGKDASGAAIGPLISFANKVNGFDVIFGDHTDVQYSGSINGALVFENRSKGLTYSRAKVSVDSAGKAGSRSVEFVTPLAKDVTPDQAVVSMLAPYRVLLSAALDTLLGTVSTSLPRGGNVERGQEVAIGNLISDAQRARYNAQLAVTNSGAIRAPLPSAYAPASKSLRRPAAGYASGPPFDLTAGDMLTTLPFGNYSVTRNITGEQVYAMLENSVSKLAADGTSTDGRFLQVSGFRFTFDSRLAAGSRIKTVELSSGTAIKADATTYSIVVNDFMNSGGDGYTMLVDGEGVSREVMADVVSEYVKSIGTVAAKVEGRITNLGVQAKS